MLDRHVQPGSRRPSGAIHRRRRNMPHARLNGASLWYDETGSGGETVVFGHGLAFSGAMFEAQVAALRDRYRCITFDLRGHGQSELTTDGYDMDTLAGDAVALIEHVGGGPIHLVGLSIGGFTGLRIALRKPQLLCSLTLIGSRAFDGSETALAFKAVPFIARTLGMRFLAGTLMKSMFSPAFLNDPARAPLREKWRQHFLADRKLGVSRAARGVIAQKSVGPELGGLRLPVLMIGGEVARVVPRGGAQRTISAIPGGRMVTIPGAGHACTIEQPEQVNRVIAGFLQSATSQPVHNVSA